MDTSCQGRQAKERLRWLLLGCPKYENGERQARRNVGIQETRREKLGGGAAGIKDTVQSIEDHCILG